MSDNLTTEASDASASAASHFDIDYNVIQDRLINATITPFNYVWEIQLYYKISFMMCIFIFTGLIYPLIVYIVKSIKAICHPIMFPYKHVVITGCGTGLGKALVQEIYMKGAYITMIGRDKDKLLKVA
jgi:hypothetical protein